MLASIPDNRGRQGRRHELAALLAATVCGILAGAKGCTAIAQWISLQDAAFWHALGFYRKPPTTNCYRSALLSIVPHELEKVLGKWISQLFPEATAQLQGIAMDGKTLCGTLQAHGQSIHLLSLLDHATGGVLRQMQMPVTTNEHKAALELLKSLMLKGKVITADAIFCQKDLCQRIIDDDGDYYIKVEANQPSLMSAIEAEFTPGFSPLQRAETPVPANAA